MRIVQISDSHISIDHSQRTADLRACIELINAATEQPAAVIHTGDVAHNGVATEYNIAKQAMDELNVPYFVIPGNKDKRPAMIEAFADEQRLWVEGQFIQYAVEDFPVRLLMLDTLSGSSNKGLLGDARFDHIEKMLKAAPAKPIAVFMHHSPFEVSAIPDPFQFEDWAEVDRLQALLSEHSQVRAIYCGHIHRSVKGQLGDLKVNAISCMAADLRKGELTDEQRQAPMLQWHDL